MSDALKSLHDTLIEALSLRKGIIDSPDGGIVEDSSEQSLALLGTENDEWVATIRRLVSDLEYADTRELDLPNLLQMHLSKVDDGFYSGFVKRNNPESGAQGEVLIQLPKMTPEMMVQVLKTKGYLPKSVSQSSPSVETVQSYEGLYSVLKDFEGELHIHLAKSLNDSLNS